MSVHIALAKVKKEVGMLQGLVDTLQEMNTMRLERLQEHGISDPVWEQEYNTDEYTGEVIE
jgi:hypothetical protein